jgi:hypothetical protein
MSKAALIIIAAAALFAGTAHAASKTTAAKAYATLVGYFFNAQYDRQYNTLAPQQQRFISRDRFVTCYQGNNYPTGTVERWKLLDSLHVKITIPGTKTRVWTTAVSVRFQLKLDTGEHVTFAKSAHMFLVHGHWRWMLDKDSVIRFKRGGCPK